MPARAQEPPQGVSRGENFSNKPAPALFNGDCTGAGCHKGPQGLGKGQSQSGLASFLREHYTNSRESAASLAAYILKMPAGPPQPEPRAARTGTPKQGNERSGPSWFDPEPGETRTPADARKERQQQKQDGSKPARSAARPADGKPADAKPAEAKPADAKPAEARPAEESKPDSKPSSEPAVAAPAEPAAPPAAAPADQRRRTAEPAKPAPTPRNQRGRQQPAVAATPAPEPAPASVAAPAAPPPPQYDIFD